MKTRNLLRTVSLGLMIIGMTAFYARPAESPNPIGQAKQAVTYVVNVVHGDHLAGYDCMYYILLTNERGQLIAPAQAFRLGVWSYTFKETGPVTGTRVAKIVKNPNVICPNAVTFQPDSKSGTFRAGETYTFDLIPIELGPTSGE